MNKERCTDKIKAPGKRIRRTMRKNKKRLRDEVADIAPELSTKSLAQEVKRLKNLNPAQPREVSRDEFTKYISGLQPKKVPDVCIERFEVHPSFVEAKIRAIRTSDQRKAPGPDKVRIEMLQLAPKLFATPILSL